MSQIQDSSAPIARVSVSAYTVPTDFPEADGTITWDSTTIVIVEAEAGGWTGIGYTYADTSTGKLIASKLSGIVTGLDAMSPIDAYMRMWREIRNLGRPGIVSMGISAVDAAVWDLKAKLLDLPLT